MQTTICPRSGVKIFRETKLAVGRFLASCGKDPVQPMKMAIGRMRARSMNRNWKSPRFDADAYKKLTEVNWIAEYKLMYLKQQKLVTSAARPSLMSVGTQEMSKMRLVKGAATDASASESETPTSAALSAPQSLAPSPQKPGGVIDALQLLNEFLLLVR